MYRIFIPLVAITFCAVPVWAQSPEPAADEKLNQSVQRLEEHARQQEEKIKSLDEALQKMAAQNEEQLQRQEDSEAEALAALSDQDKTLRVYGFTDAVAYRFFIPKDSYLSGLADDGGSSFASWHLNLYLERQLNDSFRTLAEVRFLTDPNGEVEELPTPMGGEFKRVDTTVSDSFGSSTFRWGGVLIERAWIEYKLSDYFAMKVGHFLTPYGIWNVEHSPTVTIPARQPYLVYKEDIPGSQTGLSFYGRMFPSDSTRFDYGLTISNGRGPMDTLQDLDDNKAFGLRLQLSYEGQYNLSLGTYLFTGEYTNITKKIESFEPFHVAVERTEWYRESAAAFDLRFEWEGFLIQSEYVLRQIEYLGGRRPAIDHAGTQLEPDHYGQSQYVLLAYRLPIEGIELRPYFLVQWMDKSNFADNDTSWIYTGGLNWKINSFVVAKVELTYIDMPENDTDNWYMVSSQLAASF